jgi:hypothetical protein
MGGCAVSAGPTLDDAADPGVFDAGRIDAGKMVRAPVDAVDHEGQVLAHLVGEIFVHDAAGDGRRGCGIVKLEGHRITFLPIGLQRLVHVADDVAALTEFTQRRFHLRAKLPDAGCMFRGQPHLFQLGETAQAKRAVELAAQCRRFMAQIEEPIVGLGGHGAVDAGEAVLIDFGRQLAALLDLGDGAEFQRGQFARPLTNAIGEIVAIDDQVLAQIVLAPNDDMDMGMAGIVVIDSHPIELRAKVGLDAAHQIAGVPVRSERSAASSGETMKRNWWRSSLPRSRNASPSARSSVAE